ncbi:MAG: TolC family protein [Parachlamydiaceae bacterium]|nr:TolC family protein [Parachlamydiaceae bacterium]
MKSIIKFTAACFIFTSFLSQNIQTQETPPVDNFPEESPLILDLPTAINLAITSNRNFANSLDNIQRAQLSIDLSLSAFDLRLIPSGDVGFIGGGKAGLGGTVGGSLEICKKFTFGTQISLRPYASVDAKHYHTGLQAKIVQPLLKGFGKEYTLAPVFAAQFAYRTAFRGSYASGVEMIFRLINAMYNIVRLETILKLDTEALQRLTHFYSAIKVKERIGMADSLDVYRTEIELKASEDSINSSQESLQDAKDRLRELLTLPLNRDIVIDLSTEYVPLDPIVEESISSALANRVEIEQAEDRWNETRRLSKLAKSNLLPDLDLVLDFTNFGYDEVFTESFTTERDSRWGIGFMTSTDWNRTAQQIAYQQSIFTVVNAERSYNQTQDSVILDVKRAIRALHRASQKIVLQLTQIHSSEGGLKLAKLKFNRGLANNFDVIQAEKTLRNAQSAYQSAIIDHKIGEYRFLSAVGLLVDKPKICL